jgi:ribosome-binding ATPase
MRVALVGAPYSGKTLIFETLTGLETGKKEENIGSIKVPDERIEYLDNLYKPKKKVLAEIIISDFNVQDDKKNIINSKVKNLIQKSDILIFVLRNFKSELSDSPLNPANEYQKLKDEIIISDCLVIEKRIEKEEKERKNLPEIPIIKKLNKIIENSKFPSDDDFSIDELKIISNYSFLSLKKFIVAVNQEEGNNEIPEDLKNLLDQDKITYFPISAVLENELNKIPLEERQSFLKEYGLQESASNRFIRHIFKKLGLISFLTTGEDEVRAWPIKDGTPASQAAGKIHSDIEKGFIRAEVISYDEFIKYNSEAECKKAGKFRLEGRDYIVKDGDIISFRFNL